MSALGHYSDVCSLCGKPARVHMGATSYCLSCYNHLADYLADVASPTNDSYQILTLDPSGHAVEFSVERFSMGVRSAWTAIEVVPDDDPRREWGYVGRRVSILVNTDETTQEEALDALSVKAQRLVGHASTETYGVPSVNNQQLKPHCPGQTLWAKEAGIARIESEADGGTSVVVDGQRLTPEQFLDLLSCYEGHDLCWQVHNPTDDLPNWL